MEKVGLVDNVVVKYKINSFNEYDFGGGWFSCSLEAYQRASTQGLLDIVNEARDLEILTILFADISL